MHFSVSRTVKLFGPSGGSLKRNHDSNINKESMTFMHASYSFKSVVISPLIGLPGGSSLELTQPTK